MNIFFHSVFPFGTIRHRCGQRNANKIFLFRFTTRREYPCDHYTSVINVTLLMTGCPRIDVHTTAVQLLQVLDKRFFGNVGPLQTECEKGKYMYIWCISQPYQSAFIYSWIISAHDLWCTHDVDDECKNVFNFPGITINWTQKV